jgi:hypothetical protein
MNCKICSGSTCNFGESKVLGKYKAEYVQCTNCGFMFAKNPDWLSEAYSNAITSSDMGTVSRTDQNSLKTKAIIDVFFSSAKAFLDYGAGYGMFVRRMRDLGYNFFAYDPYCQNMFANQFLLSNFKDRNFDLITAFEVFEHLEDQLGVFNLLLKHGENLLLTTELLPTPTPALSEWWYYAPEHGQHIGFHTLASLKIAAAANGRFFCSDGNLLHLFSRKRVSEYWFRKVTSERNSQWLGLWRRRQSLLLDDWQNLRKEVLSGLGYPT